MAAKKATLPASAKKKALPVMPSRGKPAAPGSGAKMPPWVASAAKKTAAKRTARKSGGK